MIIKPTNACNIRCRHCYNSTKKYTNNILSNETLEKLYRSLFKEYDDVRFIWHGGEPLIMGLDYFEKAYKLQCELSCEYSCATSNIIQTNGILLDDKFLDFFEKNDFGIGISFDGPVNDVLRFESEIVEKRIRTMIHNKINFGVLSVMCKKSIEKIIEVYDYFNDLKISTCQIDTIFDSGAAHDNSELLLTVEEVNDAFFKLFKRWFYDVKCITHFRMFEDIIHLISGKGKISCANSSCMYQWLSIDPDGSIYPCARYYPKEYCLGNIDEVNSISSLFNTSNYNSMVSKAIKRRNECKEICDIYQYCNGGCNNQAIIDGDLSKPEGNGCRMFKSLFNVVKSEIDYLNILDIDNVNPLVKNEVYYIKTKILI